MTEPGASLAPGRTVLRRLGGGGDHDVFLVWDDWLGATGAAKVVRAGAADPVATVRRLAREANVLDRLRHPAVPRVLDRRLESAPAHILLEHVDGPTLRTAIRQGGPVDAALVPLLGVQLAGALHFLARAGFVHLDVKPANVVLTPRLAKLVDFGFAQPVEVAAVRTGVVGTRSYLAPELCAGEPVGPPTDVWCLGMMLYEAVEGERPFAPVEDGAPLTDHPNLVAAPRPMERAEPAVTGLVLACLAKDPAGRPAARDVVAALRPHAFPTPDP